MKKPITAKKNQLISFYRNSPVPDGYGGTINAPVVYWENTSASAYQLKSSRRLEANQDKLVAGFEFRVRMRIDKNVFVDDIIEYRGKGYVIHSSIPDDIYKEDLVIIAMSNGIEFDTTT